MNLALDELGFLISKENMLLLLFEKNKKASMHTSAPKQT